MTLFTNVNEEKLKQILLQNSFYIDKALKYEKSRFKGSCSVIHFESGKLLIQGKDELVSKISSLITQSKAATEVKQEFKTTKGVVVGSDESLKGDTFGGIVVAGVKVDDKQKEILKAMTICDSKKLSDSTILAIAPRIKEVVPYHVISLSPKEYNEYTSENNQGTVSSLLNKLHKEVKKKLGEGKHIVDKYPGCAIGDIMETKADSNYVEVASASILAREGAIEQLNGLSRKLGMNVPKGSSHVKEALLSLKKSGKDPREFVKMHFRNVKEMF